MRVTEDDLYRSTTQFKHWSFTSQQLAEQRLKTNITATERVKANFARLRAQRAEDSERDEASSGMENGSGANTPNPVATVGEVDCLTAAEERAILDEFCERAEILGTHCNYPLEVKATCIQYLRRFYLYNSVMTYRGQDILRTCMFLATKAEGLHESVDHFAAHSGRNITSESVLATEYLIMQALRYNLDVRHPFRGLKGGHIELVQLAHGKYTGAPDVGTPAQLRDRMLALPSSDSSKPSTAKMTPQALEKRITDAYASTSATIKSTALFTDAYFLYTPSQIWLSALLLADPPLLHFYLSLKLPPTHPSHTKLLSTLHSCSNLFSTHRTFRAWTLSDDEKKDKDAPHKAKMKELIAKMNKCQDPEKKDLVKLNQSQKRDALADGELEESKKKRRKLAREGYEKEAESFWGPELGAGKEGKGGA